MSTIITAIAIMILAYLVGSANSSIIISKIMGADIREHGSGNAGATNMLRTYGKRFGVLTLACDVLKGVLAVGLGMIAEHMLRNSGALESMFLIGIKYYAGVAAVLGHNYPVFFGFRGGKGIATSAAVIFMLDWRVGIVVVVVAISIMFATRYVSLGSIIGASLYPVAVIVLEFVIDTGKDSGVNWTAVAAAVIIGVLAVYRHRENIVRLVKGTESKLGQKKAI